MEESARISQRFQPPGFVSRWIAPALALIATGVASYLAYLSIDDSANPMGCGPDSGAGCSDVLTTEWSTLFGVPVSMGAILVYATILLTLLASNKQISKVAWAILVACTTMALGSGLWFSGLLYFKLNTFCQYCMVTHTCGLLITIWLWLRIPISSQAVENGGRPVVTVRPKLAGSMVAAGLLGVAFLIGGQVYSAGGELSDEPGSLVADGQGNGTGSIVIENRPGIQNHDIPADDGHDHSSHAGHDHGDDPAGGGGEVTPTGGGGDDDEAATTYRPFTPKRVTFLDGQVAIMLTGHPVIGSPDAEHFVAVIFDYTCAACRKLHLGLREAMETYDHQFAIVFMPMPLDSVCNPKLKTTPMSHRHSCYYAKLALAVWLAKPQAFDEFDHFILKDKTRPGRRATRAKAEELLGGKAQLDKALANPAINEILRNDFNLFYSPALYKKSVPVLVTEKKLHFGNPKTIEDLHKLLEENLGIYKKDQ